MAQESELSLLLICHDQQILQLLQEVPAHSVALTKTLEVWTRNFQFDRIIEITQRITY